MTMPERVAAGSGVVGVLQKGPFNLFNPNCERSIMTTSKDNTENKNDTSKQGFGSMPHEKVQEIAKKGGESSHGGKGSSHDDRKQDERS
jgi:general stress protein YciG